MAGLLDGVLPYIYSQGDRAKRHVRSLLADPLGTMEQTAGGLQDSHKEQQNLLAQAFAEPGRPFKVTDPAAMQAAATNMLAGPLGFAPAGMTYYRRTNAGTPFNNVPWAMFSESDGAVAHYGKNKWTFDDSQLPRAEVLDATTPAGQREIARALLRDRDLLRALGAHPKKLAQEANPRNIVDSAGLWDNPDIVQSLWNNLFERAGYRAAKTADGAVVFDESLIRQAR